MRTRIACLIRRLAEFIDPTEWPRRTGYSFTFERGVGIVWHSDLRGCPVWYLSEADYERAHNQRSPIVHNHESAS